eukprot:scaffold12030_cov66-Phaeocystis_antarctica.AAC.5
MTSCWSVATRRASARQSSASHREPCRRPMHARVSRRHAPCRRAGRGRWLLPSQWTVDEFIFVGNTQSRTRKCVHTDAITRAIEISTSASTPP